MVKVKWNQSGMRKVRTSAGAQKAVDREAQRLSAKVDRSLVLPNDTRRNRAGATVISRKVGHAGRRDLLAALGRRS